MEQKEIMRSVPGDILHAIGKGFLIACAGMLVGAIFGNPTLAAGSVWGVLAVGVAGLVGMGCMFASAAAHRSCWKSQGERSVPEHEISAAMQGPPLPAIGTHEREAESRNEGRFVALVNRAGGLGSGRGL